MNRARLIGTPPLTRSSFLMTSFNGLGFAGALTAVVNEEKNPSLSFLLVDLTDCFTSCVIGLLNNPLRTDVFLKIYIF